MSGHFRSEPKVAARGRYYCMVHSEGNILRTKILSMSRCRLATEGCNDLLFEGPLI